MRDDVAAFRDEAEHVYADMKAAGYNDELYAWGHNSGANNTPCSATYNSSWSDSGHSCDELFNRTVQSLFMISPSVEEVKFIDVAPLTIRLEPMATDKEGYGDVGCNERIDNGEAMDDDGGAMTIDGKEGIADAEAMADFGGAMTFDWIEGNDSDESIRDDGPALRMKKKLSTLLSPYTVPV